MTIEEVKSLLRITTNDKDDFLSAVLPLAVEYVKEECNNSFLDENGVEVLPGGIKMAIAKLCEHYMRESGVQSESLSRHSVTYSVDGIPKDIMKLLRPYRKVKFV
jgi:Phage gp6-like head-tail connector protein